MVADGRLEPLDQVQLSSAAISVIDAVEELDNQYQICLHCPDYVSPTGLADMPSSPFSADINFLPTGAPWYIPRRLRSSEAHEGLSGAYF